MTDVCCLPSDLRSDGEAEGRHAGDDPVKSSRSPHRETHQVPRLTGTGPREPPHTALWDPLKTKQFWFKPLI